MWSKILIILLGLILFVFGTYLIHWVLNAKEWVEIYIKKTKTIKQKGVRASLRKRRPVAKALSYRDKWIALLAADKPEKAPMFIYIIMTSSLLMVLMLIGLLFYWWQQIA